MISDLQELRASEVDPSPSLPMPTVDESRQSELDPPGLIQWRKAIAGGELAPSVLKNVVTYKHVCVANRNAAGADGFFSYGDRAINPHLSLSETRQSVPVLAARWQVICVYVGSCTIGL